MIRIINEINESRRPWLLKKIEFAAKRIKKGVNFKVWQDGFRPVHLSTNLMLEQRVDYIHNNPIKEGYVFQPENYVYSCAIDYYTKQKGLIALQMLI